uniref:PadR family transcriptional regulator n=1 Tax=Thermosphaera aggregans TaxID=54254 RepID=A0A7C2BKY6_9CREN
MRKFNLKKYLRLKILEMLSTGDKHGYALAKEIFNTIGLKPNTSLLYPLLRILEKEGLISSREETQGSRVKKVYSITDKGLEYLEMNKPGINEIRLFERRMKELKELGIPDLLITLKNIYENLDKLGEKERRFLKDLVYSFRLQLRNLIGEYY